MVREHVCEFLDEVLGLRALVWSLKIRASVAQAEDESVVRLRFQSWFKSPLKWTFKQDRGTSTLSTAKVKLGWATFHGTTGSVAPNKVWDPCWKPWKNQKFLNQAPALCHLSIWLFLQRQPFILNSSQE